MILMLEVPSVLEISDADAGLGSACVSVNICFCDFRADFEPFSRLFVLVLIHCNLTSASTAVDTQLSV